MSEPGGSRTDGGRTGAAGTPVAVDVSRDRLTRIGWVVLLGGPVIWFAHFMVVYLVAEAGCAGGGPGLRAFNPPVPKAVTLAGTAVAAASCLAVAIWAYRGGPSAGTAWRPTTLVIGRAPTRSTTGAGRSPS